MYCILYADVNSISIEDETELSVALPAPDQLLAPDEFDRLLNERSQLADAQLRSRLDLWNQELQDATSLEGLEALAVQVREAIKPLVNSEPWKVSAVAAGMGEIANRRPWDLLVSEIQTVDQLSISAQVALLKHGPVFQDEPAVQEQLAISDKILLHLTNGGKLSRWALLTRPSWKEFIKNSRVTAGSPQTAEHFRALSLALRLKISRTELIGLWQRQMERFGALSSKQFRDEPEKVCQQFVPAIHDCLGWHVKVWKPIEGRLQEVGFKWACPQNKGCGYIFIASDT